MYMNKEPIIIIDDDDDDIDFIQEAWDGLNFPNSLIFFKYGEDVLKYLESEKSVPFLIISDINLPKMSGFDLKEKLLKSDIARYKSIPLIFWSTELSNGQKQRAYDLGVNGIFLKENSIESLKQSLTDIINYWEKSRVPD